MCIARVISVETGIYSSAAGVCPPGVTECYFINYSISSCVVIGGHSIVVTAKTTYISAVFGVQVQVQVGSCRFRKRNDIMVFFFSPSAVEISYVSKEGTNQESLLILYSVFKEIL